MEFEYPLLLVAKREYLESLQQGNVHLVNCLHYQRIEEDDATRGDRYDSAIKCSFDSHYIPENIRSLAKNGRLIIMGSYIKCFFHYRDSNVIHSSKSGLMFSISAESAKELRSFNEDYALLIYNVSEFLARFESVCKQSNLVSDYFYGDVQYVADKDYVRHEVNLINAVLGKCTENISNPVFLKREKYQAQQEFRIAITLKENGFTNSETGRILYESVDLTMKGIKDISEIIRLDQLIQNPLILRVSSESE